jgi:antiviral helicase SKI2
MISYFQIFQKENTHKISNEEKHFSFSYPLDDFQEEGMYRIHNNENILVTAHTGSGKTTFALYAIAQAFARGQKVIYTSPIKSLSNQKYAEFKKLFGVENVGILTGDIKMNPGATCIIMTTEVLRNMLYKSDEETISYIQNVGSVIFDEVHYINDKDRGKVWEEVIILLPKHIILVMLSATINGSEEFAQWVGKIKERNTMLIPTVHRVVPLQHYLFDYEKAREYQEFRRERTKRRKEALKNGDHLDEDDDGEDDAEKVDFPWKLMMNASHQIVHMDMIRKTYKKYTTLEILDLVVSSLHYLKKTPALFFVFSRKECEKLAKMVYTKVIDHTIQGKIQETFHRYMAPYKQIYDTLPQYHEVYELMQRGVAYHHSGMIPILKEIVEILFGMGYIKILFATETFAVGVNMPTKTVIFPSLKKYDNDGLRYINHAEYMQMSGRAGRRGLDKVGNVILLPCMDLPTDVVINDILNGKSPKVSSKFVPTYQFVLKHLWKSYHKDNEEEDESNKSKSKSSVHICNFLNDTYFMDSYEKSSVMMVKKYMELEGVYNSIQIQIDEKDVSEYDRLQNKLSGNGLGEFFVMKPKDKQKIEKELDGIRKKYNNPSFEERIQKYEEKKKMKCEMDYVKSEMDGTSTFLFQNIENMKVLLKTHSYLDESGTFTKRGMISMGINECNELLFAYMLENYMSDTKISYAEWIGLFALFIEEKEQEDRILGDMCVSSKMKSIMTDLNEKATFFANEELKHHISIGTSYVLNYEFVEVLYEWASGKSYLEIKESQSIFDGNFVKAVMRVQNIVEDVKSICKMIENYELLQIFENAEVPLLRDIAQINSLYIKM